MRLVAAVLAVVAVPAWGETLTIRRFASERDDAELVADQRWKLVRLPTVACTDTDYSAKLSRRRVAVSITTEVFQPTKHRYDSDGGGTIDGKASLGHDGIYSEEYARANFSNSRVVSGISVRVGAREHDIPKRHFVFMLRPHLAFESKCWVDAFWVAQERLVIVRLSGGDSAGSYITYLLFDRTGFRGQYSGWAPLPDHFAAHSLAYFERGIRLGFELSH